MTSATRVCQHCGAGGTGGAGAVLCGLGAAQPDQVVSNETLGAQLGVSPEWIATRTGITHRARAGHDVSTTDLAVCAGRRALASDGCGEVQCLVVATISADQRCPATAAKVAARLGLPAVPAFDLGAACSGLLYALQVAAGLLGRAAERVLVIAADRMPQLTDPTDPLTAPLFGDGAGALVVRAGSSTEPGALGPILLGADATHAHAIEIPYGGYLRMQGTTTFQQAVHRMAQAARRAAHAAGWQLDDIDWLVPHQANARISAAVGRRLGIDPTRVLQHIERVGNTSAASIPLALTHAVSDRRLRAGHRVLLAAFGAGLTWGATTLVWPDLPVASASASGKEQAHER